MVRDSVFYCSRLCVCVCGRINSRYLILLALLNFWVSLFVCIRVVVFLCFCVCLWLFIGMWQCFCVFVLLCVWQCFCLFVLLCVWQCFCARSRHPARPLQLSRKPRHYYQLPKPCSATQYNRDTNYPAIFPPGEDDVGRAVNTVAVSVVASPHMRLDLLRIPSNTISMLHYTLFIALLVITSPHMMLDLVQIPCNNLLIPHFTRFIAILCYYLTTG